MTLSELIRQEIEVRGSMSFARFMALALYHPQHGYYEREGARERLGKRGDYVTSVSTGCLFGTLLAHQWASWADALGGRRFTLVEAGAHDGQLALDVLDWLERYHNGCFQRLEYWILEPSIRRRGWQAQTLARYQRKVRWIEGWNELGTNRIRGVVFSNELLDAMPVHRLGWSRARSEWYEWGVTWNESEDRFLWTPIPADPALGPVRPVLPAELAQHLPEGFATEISPAAIRWWTQAAQALNEGWLVTIDYGLSAEEFLTPSREAGTLRAYARHLQVADVLAQPGEQDLTAHVNFTSLIRAGEAAGFTTIEWMPQGRFLTRIVRAMSEDPALAAFWTPAFRRQFQSLTHPDHLGGAFSVLIQSRKGSGC